MAEREPAPDTITDINMSTTDVPPLKRKLSQPNLNASVDPKKRKLTESNTNTISSKAATKEKDTGAPKDDLKPPKKATAKKPKPTTSAKPGAADATSSVKPSNASEEFPNGHLYCHQCNKKRDASRESLPLLILESLHVHYALTEVISCTEAAKKCKTKYCKPCLGNRYGEDIDEIKKSPPSGRGKSKMPYTFKSVFSAYTHLAPR